jgi:mitochondrial fission protein ELM1
MPLLEESWVLTTGEAGMRSQALGLAAAVGLPIAEKRIVLPRFWGWLPAGLAPVPLGALSAAGDRLAPPWPRLVVACGRRSIGPALAVKRAAAGRTIAAYVQNPELAAEKFDLVVALAHDGLAGGNVVIVETALHNVTAAGLKTAAALWRARLIPDGAPLIGVLVGGDNGSYRLSGRVLQRLVDVLAEAQRRGFRAFLTPSRRTSAEAVRFLDAALREKDLGAMWDGTGENPYLGILALADRLVVTAESISMISEALATGRPVHVLPLEGRGRRHDAFLRRLVAEGTVSTIAGDALDWGFAGRAPIFPAAAPARRLRALLDARA